MNAVLNVVNAPNVQKRYTSQYIVVVAVVICSLVVSVTLCSVL